LLGLLEHLDADVTVAGLLGEEVTVQHLVVDVPVTEFALQKFSYFITFLR